MIRCLSVSMKKGERNAILLAAERVLNSGQFVKGKEVCLLEEAAAKRCFARYAVGVNSGTDALFLSLKALRIGSGDEVITTPFTFIAASEAIANCGAKPVFADIGDDLNIDADLIERAVTRKTKAILPVHLFGRMADMRKIKKIAKKYKLKIIEDSAQAFGTPLSGDVACISFYPTKVLGACGDAGMVITNSKKLAEKIRILANHGSSPGFKYLHLEVGINSRMDEIQAAILREKLKTFDEFKKTFSYDQTKYYPIPLHLQPCFRYLGYKKGDFPKAELAAEKVVLHQHLQISQYRGRNKNRKLC